MNKKPFSVASAVVKNSRMVFPPKVYNSRVSPLIIQLSSPIVNLFCTISAETFGLDFALFDGSVLTAILGWRNGWGCAIMDAGWRDENGKGRFPNRK